MESSITIIKSPSFSNKYLDIFNIFCIFVVWGVIFDISEDQKSILDKFEGLGWGYDELKLLVINDLGEEVDCVCYISRDDKYLDGGLKPHGWYKDFCLVGAREHSIPEDYILTIESVDVTENYL